MAHDVCLSQSTKQKRGRKLVLGGTLVVLLTAGVLVGEEATKKDNSLNAIAAATKEAPYVNSLGMKFVPVPGTAVLFSIWETRVKDFEAFAKDFARDIDTYKDGQGYWPKPIIFEQTGEHPAVSVTWGNATKFCEWLTEQERTAGKISARQSYRLPTDEEWSRAVGLEKESDATPRARHAQVKNVYPWGSKWPPPKGAGNYEVELKVDDYKGTSPVGSFEANRYGIYDLGGNVWEWCQDLFDAQATDVMAGWRVQRGASFSDYESLFMLSSSRHGDRPDRYSDWNGFRCVLVVDSSR